MVIATLGWLFDAALKGSVLILIAAAIQQLAGPRIDARWRHLLWVVVLVRLLAPVTLPSPLSMFNAMPAPQRIDTVRLPVEASMNGLPFRTRVSFTPRRDIDPFFRAMFAIWIAGVVVFGSRTLIGAGRMHLRVRAIARRGRIGAMEIVETGIVRSPALYGVVRPLLLVPPGLTPEETRHVVLHETWHLKRMDVAVSWLLAAAQVLHWFNPLVWFAASRIREERELSCDELALSLLEEEERPQYGRTILTLLQRFASAAPVPALVGIVNDKEKMKRRITMIASFTNRPRFTAMFLLFVAAFGIAGLTNAAAPDDEHVRVFRHLDPTMSATAAKLDARVSFELTGASLSELLSTVSNKAGVTVLQSPEIASKDVQKARFTVKADNVPAHAVLSEALMPFAMSAEPGADAVTIVDRPSRLMRHELPEDVDIEEEEVNAEQTRVFVKKLERRPPPAATADDGKLHRELVIKLKINGEESNGKLTIDIVR